MSPTIFADGVLNGRVAFVTGGGTGITGGVARAFAEAGASVALVSRKMDHLQPAADAINNNGGKAIPIVADVRQPETVEQAVAQTIEQLGKIDIVVNGAAGNFLCPAEEMSPGRMVPGCCGESSSSRTLHPLNATMPAAIAAARTHRARSVICIMCFGPCGLVVEVESHCVEASRRGARKVRLDVGRREILLGIRAFVLGPDLEIARAEAQRCT